MVQGSIDSLCVFAMFFRCNVFVFCCIVAILSMSLSQRLKHTFVLLLLILDVAKVLVSIVLRFIADVFCV